MTTQKSFLSLFFLQPTNGLLLPLILLDRKLWPDFVTQFMYTRLSALLSLLWFKFAIFFQWKLRTIVAIFQQYVYCNAIEFRSVCNVRLHKLSPIKKLFPYLYFLDYLCFPLFPLVFPGCPVFVCFPFCPLFFFCLSLFPVFALVFHCFHCSYLFSLVIPCFSCFPRSLFSLAPLFLSVFYCFPVLFFQFSLVLPCFSGFYFLFLFYCVFLCFHG